MEKEPTVFNTSLKYGLIGGLILIIVATLLYMTLSPSSTIQGILAFFINTGVCVAIGIFAIKSYRDEVSGGVISFSRAFIVSFLSILITGILLAFFQMVYFTLVDPGYQEEIINNLRIMYEEMGMEESAIETAMYWVELFQHPIISLFWNIFMYTLGSALLSLVTGLIMKREEPQVNL